MSQRESIRREAFEEAIAAVERIRQCAIDVAESVGKQPNYDALMGYNTALEVLADTRDRRPMFRDVPWRTLHTDTRGD